MALIVEDGTGKPDADALVSVDFATNHLASTGYAAEWAAFDTTKKENLIKAATRQMSLGFVYNGTIKYETQSQPFPREDLTDREGREVTGVPVLIQMATAELAHWLSENDFLEDSELAGLERVKVGPIDLKTSTGGREQKVIPEFVVRAAEEFGYYRFGRRRTRRLIAG